LVDTFVPKEMLNAFFTGERNKSDIFGGYVIGLEE